MGLTNDERGWIMTSISGVACVLGASIICADLIIRLFPGKRNFRIQDSDKFLSSSLSLSFGVMLFSSLFSMLPSAKSSLQKGGLSPKAAAWTLIGCFLAGAVGIQFVSRIIHHFIPSHVVDCGHTHDEEASKGPSDGNGDARHENAHPPNRDRTYGQSNELVQHGQHLHATRPKWASRKSTSHKSSYNVHGSQAPFVPSSSGNMDGPPPGKKVSRRPSLQARLSQTISSIASGSKASCDCDGPCYGFSEPCGSDCFKNMQTRQSSTRSIIRAQLLRGSTQGESTTEATPLLGEIREDREEPPRLNAKDREVPEDAIDTFEPTTLQNEHGTSSSLRPTKSHASEAESSQEHPDHHHHHVPTNVFMSIGLQTSIAIALHKLPEGFITYATNHANPQLGFSVFLALFIHNITEGFAMALPLYLAINSRWKAMFWSSLLGGFSQPLGAGVAALWFKVAGSGDMAPGEGVYGCMFAITSGIMTSVALQLFSESLDLTHNRGLCMIFAFVGMGILGVSSALTA